MNAFTRAIRRAVLGPTDEEINEQVLAEGGPGYPVPPIVNTTPPTTGAHSLGFVTDRATASMTIAAARTDGTPTAGDPMPDDFIDDRPQPGDGTPGSSHDNDTAVQPISAPAAYTGDRDAPTVIGRSTVAPTDPYDSMKGGVSDADEWAADPRPVTDSGVHHLDANAISPLPERTITCTACEGKGSVTRTVNSLLRDTVALIPVDGGDQVIREFYRRLLNAAPDLAPLFPRDLLTAATQDGASPGAMQRDKLLQALIAVSELYGGSADDMQRLDTAIGVYGRSHAAFQRPDGTVRGATEQEYEAVIAVFVGLLTDAFGEQQFTAVHAEVWQEALNYVKVGMLWEQFHSGARAARYPRRDGHHA